jgi:hypothetical protein
MSEHIPRIDVRARNGFTVLREGLSVCFYMRRPHVEVMGAVRQVLDMYVHAIGPGTLALYAHDEDWLPLDDSGWDFCGRKLLAQGGLGLLLRDDQEGVEKYRFEYRGNPLGAPSWALADDPGPVCAVEFWLPTEYLESHGPEQVRDLVLRLAAPLPFNSGHAGLSFNGILDLAGVSIHVDKYRFRYPGLDIPDLGWHALKLGTRVRGAYWMTFLGQPVLGSLGGADGLRSRLHSPETSLQELGDDRAVVTLGPWPEAGDTEQGQLLPAYRELARALEPWTYFEEHLRDSEHGDRRRWERRFLD